MLEKVISAFALFVFLVIHDPVIAKVEGAIDQPFLSAIASGAAGITMIVMCFTYLSWLFGHTLRHAVRDLFRASSRWHGALNLGAFLVLVAAYHFLGVAIFLPFVADNGTEAVILTGVSLLIIGLTYFSAKWIFRWKDQDDFHLGLAIRQAEIMGASEEDIIEAIQDADPLSWRNIFKRLKRIRPKRSIASGKSAPERATKAPVQDGSLVGAPVECKPSRLMWVFWKVLIVVTGLPLLYAVSTTSNLGKTAFSAGDYSTMAVYFGASVILALPTAYLVAKFFGVPMSEFYKSKGNSELADAVSTMFD